MVVRLSSRLVLLITVLVCEYGVAYADSESPPLSIPDRPLRSVPAEQSEGEVPSSKNAHQPGLTPGAIPYPDDPGIPDRLTLPNRRPATVPEVATNSLLALQHTGGPAGEYTTQQALLLAWIPENDDARPVQLEVARLVCATTHVIVVAPSAHAVDDARLAFQDAAIADDNITFLESPIDTPWIRDYGPFAMRTGEGQIQLIDAPYGTDRLLDDSLPTHLAKHLELPVVDTNLLVEGGNLISNGDGLLVCSTNMIGENQDQGFTLKEIRAKLLEEWHAREVVFVDPIAGEPTGHVDMLMTFPAKDTVIVGDYRDDADDPFNRQLLNETAERMQSVRLPNGRDLKVVRVPMPKQSDEEAWPTYCNVVYANGVLLIPYYPEDDDQFHEAMAVYRRALPGWRIAGVDCSSIIQTGGALHCLTMTIPADRTLNDKRVFRGRRVVRVPAVREPAGEAVPRWRPPVTN